MSRTRTLELVHQIERDLAELKSLLSSAQDLALTATDLVEGYLYQHERTKRFFWYKGIDREQVQMNEWEESFCFLDGEQRPVKFRTTHSEAKEFIAALKPVK